MKNISRRNFLKIILSSAGALLSRSLLSGATPAPVAENLGKPSIDFGPAKPILSIINGKDARKAVRRAVDSLGGIERFVGRGDIVVVKPNMSWDRNPKQAANTNPDIVSEMIKMCYESGAKKVKVFDRCCSNSQRSYANSGIADAARNAGADVFHIDDWNFVKAEFSYESPLEGWPIYRDAISADCFINMPVLKHHSLTKLTLSIKNLMGIMGGSRGKVHWGIDEKLAHLMDLIKPNLTVMDATRVLMANGPSGGNLSDVKKYDIVMASTDPVLIDSNAARLVGVDPSQIGYIIESSKLGLGLIDASSSQIFEASL